MTLLITMGLVVLVIYLFLRPPGRYRDPGRRGADLDRIDSSAPCISWATRLTTSRFWR